jgi:hypothetical protein
VDVFDAMTGAAVQVQGHGAAAPAIIVTFVVSVAVDTAAFSCSYWSALNASASEGTWAGVGSTLLGFSLQDNAMR